MKYRKKFHKKRKPREKQMTEGKLNETKFIAFYKSKKVTINAKSLYDAKKQIIDKLKVPKKDYGIVSVLNKTEYDKQQFRFEQKLRKTIRGILLENQKVENYSLELGDYIKILKPNIRGWKFGVERMTGSWYWEHSKFEDVVYATWGWSGKNAIPLQSSDGMDLGKINLKLKPKESLEDQLDVKKDVKKYINAMKKELPKIQKKLLQY